MLLPMFFLLHQQYLFLNFLEGPTLVLHDGLRHDLVNNIIREFSTPVVVATSEGKRIRWKNENRVQSVVLLSNSPTSLITILQGWRIWSARDHVVVVVESEKIVHEWLETLWKKTRAVNVVVMVTTNQPKFYTWFPYRANECCNVSTIIQLDENNLFPEKVQSSLNGCLLRAVTSVLSPIVIDNNNGVEPQMLKDILKKLDATVEFVSLPQGSYVWGTFNIFRMPMNGLKLLWENQIDIMFSSMRLEYDMTVFAEHLPMHTQEELIFFVPAPRLASKVKALFLAFPLSIWLMVLVTFTMTCIVSEMIHYLLEGRWKSSILRSLALSLNLPFATPEINAHRVLAIFTFIFGIHITTAYQASLMHFLSHTIRQEAIRTIEDLAKSDYPVAIHDTVETHVRSYKNPWMRALVAPERCTFKDFLTLNATASRQEAVLGPRISFSTAISDFGDDHGSPKIDIIEHPIMTMPMVFYISMGHPLAPRMHRYTLWLIEAGLPQQYLKKYSKVFGSIPRTLKSFSLNYVIGAFYILGSSLTLAGSIFMLERFIQWRRLRGRRFNSQNNFAIFNRNGSPIQKCLKRTFKARTVKLKK